MELLRTVTIKLQTRNFKFNLIFPSSLCVRARVCVYRGHMRLPVSGEKRKKICSSETSAPATIVTVSHPWRP
jgi:hypothetical protein